MCAGDHVQLSLCDQAPQSGPAEGDTIAPPGTADTGTQLLCAGEMRKIPFLSLHLPERAVHLHCHGCGGQSHAQHHQAIPCHTHLQGEGKKDLHLNPLAFTSSSPLPPSSSLPPPPPSQSELRLGHHGLNIYWMADRTSCFLEQGGSRDSLRDAWAQCVAGLLEPQLLPEVCPTSIHIAWPYAYHRMCKAYAIVDPG